MAVRGREWVIVCKEGAWRRPPPRTYTYLRLGTYIGKAAEEGREGGGRSGVCAFLPTTTMCLPSPYLLLYFFLLLLLQLRFVPPLFFLTPAKGGRRRKQVGSGTDYGGAGRNAIMHGAEAEEGGKEKEEKGERGRKTILTSEKGKRGKRGEGGLLGGRPSRSPLEEEEAEASATIAANDTRFLPLLYTEPFLFLPSLYRGEFFEFGEHGPSLPAVEVREWVVKEFNYDNTLRAMITLFAVQTSEGWVE